MNTIRYWKICQIKMMSMYKIWPRISAYSLIPYRCLMVMKRIMQVHTRISFQILTIKRVTNLMRRPKSLPMKCIQWMIVIRKICKKCKMRCKKFIKNSRTLGYQVSNPQAELAKAFDSQTWLWNLNQE